MADARAISVPPIRTKAGALVKDGSDAEGKEVEQREERQPEFRKRHGRDTYLVQPRRPQPAFRNSALGPNDQRQTRSRETCLIALSRIFALLPTACSVFVLPLAAAWRLGMADTDAPLTRRTAPAVAPVLWHALTAARD